jgi:hypothetical protein
MAATEEPVNFRPAFCHREGCDARRDRAFCAACGADIAAYEKTITGELPSITEALRAVEHPTVPVTISQLPPLDATMPPEGPPPGDGGNGHDGHDAPEPPAGRRTWRHPLVLGAFTGSLVLGAGLGVLAGLV